jgi:hypothetical protein
LSHEILALPTWSRLGTHHSLKRSKSKRTPPTVPPSTLLAPTAQPLLRSSIIMRKILPSATEEEDTGKKKLTLVVLYSDVDGSSTGFTMTAVFQLGR